MRVALVSLALWSVMACGGSIAGDDVDAGEDGAGDDAGDGSGDGSGDGDGSAADAGGRPGPDAGADCSPAEDILNADLAAAELPAQVVEAADLPVVDAERGEDGALTYEVVIDPVSPSTLVPAITCAPGLETDFLLRWGHLPPIEPPVATEWADFAGYIAVSKGSIELVRALRWEGPTDPPSPRPRTDFVAPQTDPRVIRFTSSIGSGTDGLMLRIRRPVIEPVVLQIKLGPAVRVFPFEEHMSMHIVAGGWDLPVGQVEIDAALQSETAGCYARVGMLEGTWSYSSPGGTVLDRFNGSIVRDDGSRQPLRFAATGLVGPYGTFAGTAGSGGATVEGYYGRMWLFGDHDDRGNALGKVVDPSGETRLFFTALYEESGLFGSVAFRRVACGSPSAEHRNWFEF
jgi:hypothetical protein